MAAEVTVLFNEKEKKPENYKLANLCSRYNPVIGINPDEYNKPEYFGYKLTQWLLSEVEKCTVLIPFRDEGTERSSTFRAQLKRVNYDISRTSIKVTHSIEVLLSLTRKTFIDPWALIYEDHKHLPKALQNYSLMEDVHKAKAWAKEGEMSDKKVSVILDKTHMVRFVFDAYRRSFHGSDPVVASREIENLGNHWKRQKKTKQTSAINSQAKLTIKQILQPPRGLQKQAQLNPTATPPAMSQFIFGPTSGVYSWNKST